MNIELTNFELYLCFIIWFIGFFEFIYRINQLLLILQKSIINFYHYFKLLRK